MVREKKIASEKSRVGGMKVNSSVNRLKKKKNSWLRILKHRYFLKATVRRYIGKKTILNECKKFTHSKAFFSLSFVTI